MFKKTEIYEVSLIQWKSLSRNPNFSFSSSPNLYGVLSVLSPHVKTKRRGILFSPVYNHRSKIVIQSLAGDMFFFYN